MMKILMIAVVILTGVQLKAQEIRRVSRFERASNYHDFKNMSVSRLESEIEQFVGFEDNWKLATNERFLGYFGFGRGLQSNYEERLHRNASENELIEEAKKINAALQDSKGRLTPVDANVLQYFRSTFSNPNSAGNHFIISIQSEKRLIAEKIIQQEKRIPSGLLDRTLLRFAPNRRPLIQALTFLENIAKGYFLEADSEKLVKLIPSYAQELEAALHEKLEIARKYGAPVIIEFESAALSSEYSPWMLQLYRSIRQFTVSHAIQTPNGGALLVIDPRSTRLVGFSISGMLQFIKNTTRDLAKQIFYQKNIQFKTTVLPGTKDNSHIKSYDYYANDAISRIASIELKSFWLNRGGRIDEMVMQRLWQHAHNAYVKTDGQSIKITDSFASPVCQRLFL